MSKPRHFKPSLFKFLRDLADNNSREWFHANKQRYEDEVREPALQFVRDFDPRLQAISPHFCADDRKVGGSLFRIHRDVRFSKDKSPYKTFTGIQFRHEDGKDAHCPGFYLHLQPREVFAGVGIWHPDSDTLGKIRGAIVEAPDDWLAARDDPRFHRNWELSGESLVRAPKGVDPEHSLIEDLRRKDFIGVQRLTQGRVTSVGFLDDFARLCASGGPLAGFLCRAVGARY